MIRRLGGRGRDIPNDLDIENVAEEIESVGRSELAAVKSYIRLIFVHFIKLVAEAGSDVEPHWESEIFVFHSEMVSRYAPSMRQRIDIDALWRSAREPAILAYRAAHQQRQIVAGLPVKSPFGLDELLGEQIDIFELVQRLR